MSTPLHYTWLHIGLSFFWVLLSRCVNDKICCLPLRFVFCVCTCSVATWSQCTVSHAKQRGNVEPSGQHHPGVVDPTKGVWEQQNPTDYPRWGHIVTTICLQSFFFAICLVHLLFLPFIFPYNCGCRIISENLATWACWLDFGVFISWQTSDICIYSQCVKWLVETATQND